MQLKSRMHAKDRWHGRPPLWRVGLLTTAAICLVSLTLLVGCGGGGGGTSTPANRVTVSGRVIDEATQTPLANARVVFGGSKTTTDADGNFALKNEDVVTRQTSQTASLTVAKDQYGTLLQDVQFKSGTPLDLGDLTLPPRPGTGSVSGTVVDAAGSPVVDAEVRVGTGDQAQRGRTAKDGTFFISGVLTARQEISVEATGFRRFNDFVDNVIQGQETSVGTIQLISSTAEITVTGTVNDEDGNPVSGAQVDIDGINSTTDSQGKFSISGITVGVHNITVTASGFQTSVFQLDLTGNEGPLSLVLFRGNVNPPDVPFTIGGTATLQGQSDHSGITVEAIDSNQNVADSVVTGADGSFGLFVPAGTYTVRARKNGFATAETTVTVPPGGQVVTGVTLVLGS